MINRWEEIGNSLCSIRFQHIQSPVGSMIRNLKTENRLYLVEYRLRILNTRLTLISK